MFDTALGKECSGASCADHTLRVGFALELAEGEQVSVLLELDDTFGGEDAKLHVAIADTADLWSLHCLWSTIDPSTSPTRVVVGRVKTRALSMTQ